MAKFLPWVTVIGCTALGGALGCLVCRALVWVCRALAWLPPFFHHSSTHTNDLGGFIGDLIMTGFYWGLLAGVCVTLGAIGGLRLGLTLARRLKPSGTGQMIAIKHQ